MSKRSCEWKPKNVLLCKKAKLSRCVIRSVVKYLKIFDFGNTVRPMYASEKYNSDSWIANDFRSPVWIYTYGGIKSKPSEWAGHFI
jgi:hypothetical protein